MEREQESRARPRLFGSLINRIIIVTIALELPNSGADAYVLLTDGSGTVCADDGKGWLERWDMSLADMRASKRFDVYTYPLEGYGLSISRVIRHGSIRSNLPITVVALLATSILLGVTVIPALLLYMNRQVNRPLSRLVNAISQIEGGNLDYRIEIKDESQEFERINRSFNQMMEQIQTLKIDVYETELERQKIKTRYLSQQIQPHFILNALNILYSYEPEEYPLMQRMILCVTKYFRYIVNANAAFVAVEQEFDHIRNYFEIQKVRYPSEFDTVVSCGDEVRTALIPPLLVQSFSENVIKYALEVGQKITVRLTAQRWQEGGEPPRLRVLLTDTGRGIPEETLEKIRLLQKTCEHQEGLGVGIQNSIERLKYLYPQESQVYIRRGEDGIGTSVELILPLYYA